MKNKPKSVLLLLLVPLVLSVLSDLFALSSVLDAAVQPDDERKRIYIFAGGGYALLRVQGGCAEIGGEVEIFHQLFARVIMEYASDSAGARDGEDIEYAAGINLQGVYKIPLSDTTFFRLSVGGHYTMYKASVTAFGVTYSTNESYYGIGGGLGFERQLGNHVSFYAGAEGRYLMSDPPKTWIKLSGGLSYRIK